MISMAWMLSRYLPILSLEDDLMRLFGSERLMAMFEDSGRSRGRADRAQDAFHAIEKAQMKIEGNNFGIREQLCLSLTK